MSVSQLAQLLLAQSDLTGFYLSVLTIPGCPQVFREITVSATLGLPMHRSDMIYMHRTCAINMTTEERKRPITIDSIRISDCPTRVE